MNETVLPQVLVQVKAFHPAEENIKSLQLFLSLLPPKSASIHVAAPYTEIETISEVFSPQGITVGANEMLSADLSTFTGSIAARMVVDFGAKFVLIAAKGANASEEPLGKAAKEKIVAALKENVAPYVCLNESWEEHHDGHSKETMAARLKHTLGGLPSDSLKRVTIVYSADWILSALWEASSKDLDIAYSRVMELVAEQFPDASASPQLLLSVPAYSAELSLLTQTLLNKKTRFGGFFCGDLGPGTTQMQPLFTRTLADQQAPEMPAKQAPVTSDTEEPAKKRRTRTKPESEASGEAPPVK